MVSRAWQSGKWEAVFAPETFDKPPDIYYSEIMHTHEIILKKLGATLTPLEINVIDESHQHIGHVGAREGGETHFAVSVTSAKFSGLSKIQRHKLVYKILDSEMKGGIHALRISASAPEEK
jgi:BolA family transcriptional regulator, general stress-responsive regulator